eukprot:TRINITY_DN245_c0_g1::TRINITY_DN245_c0_g1_i2::g.1695::m.1695 TRINITY_DN245_c0_g1::TRINITY_DN245_c0_g1_i2::g.1695  ORF type:complete len:466 (+),score=2.89,zf-CCHH/PF10283.4/9.3e+02,zf-CCHH/PF10283.4/9.9e+03,zf-CCHH/PF10283.4/0.03,zf-CCHH/PF10283.4/35,zf-CCHH/PF10283.4/5e+03,zf-CCHH/PF10283.4/2.5e+03,zf-CCHH/PF10283.4/30,TFIIA/PF03153.8/0.38 TRINITY_DN245_c0_g1_i2:134-1531(+)
MPPPCKSGRTCYNEDCTFQHPNRWCPSRDKCTNKNCDSRHSKERTLRMQSCQYGSKCYREDCVATHPTGWCSAKDDCPDSTCELRHTVNRERKSQLCTFDTKCFREDCVSMHSKDWCQSKDDCTDFSCGMRHTQARPQCCKFEEKCKNHNCTFLHPTSRPDPSPPRADPAACKNGRHCPLRDCARTHPNDWCKYEAKCTKVDCKLRHPKTRSASLPSSTPDKNSKSTPNTAVKKPPPGFDIAPPAKKRGPCLPGSNCRDENCIIRHPARTTKEQHKQEKNETKLPVTKNAIQIPPTPEQKPLASDKKQRQKKTVQENQTDPTKHQSTEIATAAATSTQAKSKPSKATSVPPPAAKKNEPVETAVPDSLLCDRPGDCPDPYCLRNHSNERVIPEICPFGKDCTMASCFRWHPPVEPASLASADVAARRTVMCSTASGTSATLPACSLYSSFPAVISSALSQEIAAM